MASIETTDEEGWRLSFRPCVCHAYARLPACDRFAILPEMVAMALAWIGMLDVSVRSSSKILMTMDKDIEGLGPVCLWISAARPASFLRPSDQQRDWIRARFRRLFGHLFYPEPADRDALGVNIAKAARAARNEAAEERQGDRAALADGFDRRLSEQLGSVFANDAGSPSRAWDRACDCIDAAVSAETFGEILLQFVDTCVLPVEGTFVTLGSAREAGRCMTTEEMLAATQAGGLACEHVVSARLRGLKRVLVRDEHREEDTLPAAVLPSWTLATQPTCMLAPLPPARAVLVEIVDASRLERLRAHLAHLREQASSSAVVRKVDFLLAFCEQLAVSFHRAPSTEDVAVGTLRTRCVYACLCDPPSGRLRGRLYPCKSTQRLRAEVGVGNDGGDDGARPVSIQGMPRAIREWVLPHARDFDICNCQPETLRQLLAWNGPPFVTFPALARWCSDREGAIGLVCRFHRVPTKGRGNENKDLVKKLIMTLVFGGYYRSWVKRELTPLKASYPQVSDAPCCPYVMDLASEMERAREAVLSMPLYAQDVAAIAEVRERRYAAELRRELANARQMAKGHKIGRLAMRVRNEGLSAQEQREALQEIVKRSVFSIVLQDLENRMLFVMRDYLESRGRIVLALCFDGCVVLAHPADDGPKGVEFLCGEMQDAIERAGRDLLPCTFRMRIVEKPMFGLCPSEVRLS